MRARQRLLVIIGALMVTFLGGYSIMAQNTPTPTATASPEASPGASPGASPQASPVGTPIGLPVGNAEEGQKLVTQCLGCHSVDGSILVGPSWKDLYGHEVELEDGTKVIADEAYIYNSIKNPTSQIVKGFPPAMPPYAYLTDQQIADIIAYIQTLSPEGEEHDD
ncbi:MAG TPA: cytochrome c [Thermomicrobiales bacterium]|nr:cytochrome c [Thermomicrobiales bacterium]